MEYLLFVISSFVSMMINIRRSSSKSIKKILLIRLDHLGDMACTLPAIKNLKENFPGANITLVTGEWCRQLLEDHYLTDEILIYNSKKFTRDKNIVAGYKEKFILYRQLRKIDPELIIGFRDDFFTVLISLILFPNRRSDRGSIRLSNKITGLFSSSVKSLHELDTNRLIVTKFVKKYNEGVGNFFQFSAGEEIKVNSYLSSYGLNKNEYALFHPGAAWEYRRWDFRNFIRTGEYLFEKYGIRSIIIGTPNELKLGEMISSGNLEIFINAIGKTSLRETILLINSARIVICNDSSPMHFSAILQRNTIALLGPQEVDRFGPRGENVIWYHKKLECYPCAQITCKYPNMPCVNLNSTDEIIKGIDILLNKTH